MLWDNISSIREQWTVDTLKKVKIHLLWGIEMPGVITVGEFVREAKEDQASPTTSTFVHRIPQCRETITRVEEVSPDDESYPSLCFPWEMTSVSDKCVRVCVWQMCKMYQHWPTVWPMIRSYKGFPLTFTPVFSIFWQPCHGRQMFWKIRKRLSWLCPRANGGLVVLCGMTFGKQPSSSRGSWVTPSGPTRPLRGILSRIWHYPTSRFLRFDFYHKDFLASFW